MSQSRVPDNNPTAPNAPPFRTGRPESSIDISGEQLGDIRGEFRKPAEVAANGAHDGTAAGPTQGFLKKGVDDQ